MIWRRQPPEIPAHRRRETQTELVYQNLVWQYYQFYQFSANTLFALMLLYGAWLVREVSETGVNPRLALPAVLLVPACGVLYFAARDSLGRYTKRRKSVLSEPEPQGREPAPRNGDD